MKHPHPPHEPGTPTALRHLDDELASLERQGLLRRPGPARSEGARSFCSNDYLGLAAEPIAAGPSGAGAARLVSGERLAHKELEATVASWLQTESTLTFSSGYAANLGTIACLAQPGDRILSDALNHASIIDGCRLSRARTEVLPHGDLAAVERSLRAGGGGRTWLITESYFGMDADTPDLAELRGLCDAYGAALLVDEAHALGVFGPDGRGLCAEAGIVPDVLIGTFGKALGHAGAFVAGCTALTTWLWNRARSFVFSTGLSPALAGSIRAAIDRARREPWRRERVRTHASWLRNALLEENVPVLGTGHVLPVIAGSPERALAWSTELGRRGIHALPIRPPTVPVGTSRLRLSVTALHEQADLDALVHALREVYRFT